MISKIKYKSDIVENLKLLENLYYELSLSDKTDNEIIQQKLIIINKFLVPLLQDGYRAIWFLSHGALSRPLIENPYKDKTIFLEEQRIDDIIFNLSQEFVNKYGEPK